MVEGVGVDAPAYRALCRLYLGGNAAEDVELCYNSPRKEEHMDLPRDIYHYHRHHILIIVVIALLVWLGLQLFQ